MCGHFGIASKQLTKAHTAVFTQGLYVDALRGDDSTGIALVKGSLVEPIILKKALVPGDLIDTKAYTKLMAQAIGEKVLIGHNRAATKGWITDKTAHPFQIGHITLAHNGTLFYHRSLTKKNFEVDSEAITHSIADIGITDTVKKLDGAYALVYYDEEKKHLCMVRNNKRPLWIAIHEDGDTVSWASEKHMLKFILKRNKQAVEKYIEVPEHRLLTFDMASKDAISKYEEEEVEPYKYVAPKRSNYFDNNNNNKYNYGGYGNYGHNNYTDRSLAKKTPEAAGYPSGKCSFVITHISKFQNGTNFGNVVGHTTDKNQYNVDMFNIQVNGLVKGAQYVAEIGTVWGISAYPYTKLRLIARTVKLVRGVEAYQKWNKCKRRFTQKPEVLTLPSPEVGDSDDIVSEKLDGKWYTVREIKRLIAKGCCNCGDPIPFSDIGEIMEYNISANEYLCKECTNKYLVRGTLAEGLQ